MPVPSTIASFFSFPFLSSSADCCSSCMINCGPGSVLGNSSRSFLLLSRHCIEAQYLARSFLPHLDPFPSLNSLNQPLIHRNPFICCLFRLFCLLHITLIHSPTLFFLFLFFYNPISPRSERTATSTHVLVVSRHQSYLSRDQLDLPAPSTPFII